TVDAIRRPVGIAMTARVEGDGVIAGAAERLAGALPGVACLSTAVLQQDQRTIGGTPAVACQHHAPDPRPAVHGVRRTGQTLSCAHARVGGVGTTGLLSALAAVRQVRFRTSAPLRLVP